MFDPTDTELEIFREGDAAVLPTPTGGEDGRDPYTDYHAPADQAPRMAFVREYVLLTGTFVHVKAHDRPDYWCVSQTDTASAETGIWFGRAPVADQIRLGPKGSHILPGVGQDLYLQAIGSATSTITVMAVRGYPLARLLWGS